MALQTSRMKWFGVGERVRTVLFWIIVLVGLGALGYFFGFKNPTVWPQPGKVVAMGQPSYTGEMIDSFNGIKQVAYPLTIETADGKQLQITVPKEDYERVQVGQAIRWKKLPAQATPSHALRF